MAPGVSVGSGIPPHSLLKPWAWLGMGGSVTYGVVRPQLQKRGHPVMTVLAPKFLPQLLCMSPHCLLPAGVTPLGWVSVPFPWLVWGGGAE